MPVGWKLWGVGFEVTGIYYKLDYIEQQYNFFIFIVNTCNAMCCISNCLPGTELLKSPFRTEFSMGSLLWCYCRSLRRCYWSLRHYRRSLWRLEIVQEPIIIIKKDWQCKTGRGRLTPYQSEDPSPTLPTYRGKEEKEKIVEDKKGESN